jgi:siderophore synthetase component
MTEHESYKPPVLQLDWNCIDKQIAEQAAIQNLLNCYLREVDSGERLSMDARAGNTAREILDRVGANDFIRCSLSRQGIQLIASLRYWSPTGRHLFHFPLYYQPVEQTELLKLDYVRLADLIVKELAESAGGKGDQDEFLFRVIQSCGNVQQFVQQRRRDSKLYAFTSSFIQTEQALVFGHPMHPTPKSRQRFSKEDLLAYSPELTNSFSLHYFRAHRSIVQEASALSQTATASIKMELQSDPEIDEEFKRTYCSLDEYSLLPVHPWQANFLLRQPTVQQLVHQGRLQSLGSQGRPYQPTSSIRTVYHSDATFMFKLSLNIKITNSLRASLWRELQRGIEVCRILESPIGKHLRQRFPYFHVIRDPAYITVKLNDEQESAFAAILRENPFQTAPSADVTSLAALCQDAMGDEGSRLAQIVHRLANQERRSTLQVSLDWFRRYLNITLEPLLWLYFTYGITVSAHQQNTILQLQAGYPAHFFFRDNQDYYYNRSFQAALDRILPGIGQESQTMCEDTVIEERLVYYFFINNLFGLINAFGVARLVDEHLLLTELRMALERLAAIDQWSSPLLKNLLFNPKLRCKANLLTRFRDLDEVTGTVATQPVFSDIDNPLCMAEPSPLNVSCHLNQS